MHRLNLLFTLSSFVVLLVTIERFSFTTKILLEPYGFLRLHELVQMVGLIFITVLLSFFVLYISSDNLALFSKRRYMWLPILFIVGMYFFTTGNGLHEMASFTLNEY